MFRQVSGQSSIPGAVGRTPVASAALARNNSVESSTERFGEEEDAHPRRANFDSIMPGALSGRNSSSSRSGERQCDGVTPAVIDETCVVKILSPGSIRAGISKGLADRMSTLLGSWRSTGTHKCSATSFESRYELARTTWLNEANVEGHLFVANFIEHSNMAEHVSHIVNVMSLSAKAKERLVDMLQLVVGRVAMEAWDLLASARAKDELAMNLAQVEIEKLRADQRSAGDNSMSASEMTRQFTDEFETLRAEMNNTSALRLYSSEESSRTNAERSKALLEEKQREVDHWRRRAEEVLEFPEKLHGYVANLLKELESVTKMFDVGPELKKISKAVDKQDWIKVMSDFPKDVQKSDGVHKLIGRVRDVNKSVEAISAKCEAVVALMNVRINGARVGLAAMDTQSRAKPRVSANMFGTNRKS